MLHRPPVTPAHRRAILQAAADGRRYLQTHGPIAWDPERTTLAGTSPAPSYDAISLAVDTGNEWWRGLSDWHCRAALRLINRHLGLQSPRRPGAAHFYRRASSEGPLLGRL